MGCGSRKLETYFYAALKELQSKQIGRAHV